MKEKKTKEKTPKDGGFGARLTFAIIFTLGALICFILLGVFVSLYVDPTDITIILVASGVACGIYAVLGYVCAGVGIKHKWADVLLIIFAAPTCLGLIGLLAVIGGAVGIKDINNPQRVAEREKKRENSTGFGWRLTFALLMSADTVGFIILIFPFTDEMYVSLAYIFAVVAALCAFLALLGFICAFSGKKYKGANVLSIIIGSILALSIFGIPAIEGGHKGLKPWRRAKAEAMAKAQAEEERVKLLAEQSTPEKSNAGIQEVAAAATVEEVEPLPEYIQPKMGKKGKMAIMITLIVSYSLLLLMGILLASVPSIDKIISGIGICEEISDRAYGITIGVMWVTLVPSFGYYFATVSPFELSKKVKIIIAAVCAALSVVMVAIFFVIINAVKIEGLIAVKEFYEGSDMWFIPLSTVFATVGLMICHALTLFKINSAKIRNKKPVKSGDGFINAIKYVIALLLYGALSFAKFILIFKEKLPDIFILVSTILLTWLAHFASFVFSIICIVILIAVVIMYFAGVISLAYTPSGTSSEIVFKDEYGREVKLTEQPYVKDDRYQKVYKDEHGNEYVSDDGGKHVHKYEE